MAQPAPVMDLPIGLPAVEPDLEWAGLDTTAGLRVVTDGADDERPTVTTTRHEVRHRDGVLWGTHVRLDGPSGKRMHWRDPDGRKGLGGIPLADAPLYGIHRLEGPWVIVTEGEKAAQALMDAGHPAVGTVTIDRLSRAGGGCLALEAGRVIMIDKPQVTIKVQLPAAPQWVNWNKDGVALARIDGASVGEQ